MSMTTKVSTVICSLYEALCHWRAIDINGHRTLHDKNAIKISTPEYFSGESLAMHFCVKVRMSQNGYEKDGNTYHPEWEKHHYSCVHFIITDNHKVFMAVSAKEKLSSIAFDAWTNTSNHDSCWSSSGVDSPLSEYWYSIFEEVFANTPEEHRPLPIMENECADIGLNFFRGNLFEYVLVKYADNLKARPDGYIKKLTSIRQLAIKSVELELT